MISGLAVIATISVTGIVAALIMQISKSEKAQIYKWLNYSLLASIAVLVISSTIISLSPLYLAVASFFGILLGLAVTRKVHPIIELTGLGLLLGSSLLSETALLSILVSLLTVIILSLMQTILSADSTDKKGKSWIKTALTHSGVFFASAMLVYTVLFFINYKSPNCMNLTIIGFVASSAYLRLKEMLPKNKSKKKKK